MYQSQSQALESELERGVRRSETKWKVRKSQYLDRRWVLTSLPANLKQSSLFDLIISSSSCQHIRGSLGTAQLSIQPLASCQGESPWSFQGEKNSPWKWSITENICLGQVHNLEGEFSRFRFISTNQSLTFSSLTILPREISLRWMKRSESRREQSGLLYRTEPVNIGKAKQSMLELLETEVLIRFPFFRKSGEASGIKSCFNLPVSKEWDLFMLLELSLVSLSRASSTSSPPNRKVS